MSFNDFWKVMAKDIMEEDFTKREALMYGIVMPLLLIVACLLVSNF